MENIRVGIIGIGSMGSNHARKFDQGQVPGAELKAVCDHNPERLQWAKQELRSDVEVYEQADALFEADSVDAIVIATPHYDHPPLTMKGLERGLHVMCEKPAGVHTKGVREMNKAAEKSDKVFALMFNQRQRPLHQKLKDLVESGELGSLMRTNWIITTWFRSQAYYDSGEWRASWRGEGGGVLLNQCPHNLDLFQWICGMPKRVRAFCSFGKYHDIEVEDDVTAYLEYPDGATGVFITSTAEVPGTNRLELIGDRGKIVMEDNQLTFWRTRQSVAEATRTIKKGMGKVETWKCEIPVIGKGEEHLGAFKNWINAIQKGEKLTARGEEGINSLELSNAMLLSAWDNDWVDIPVDEERFYELLQEKIKNSRYQKKTGSATLDVEGTF